VYIYMHYDIYDTKLHFFLYIYIYIHYDISDTILHFSTSKRPLVREDEFYVSQYVIRMHT